MGLPYTPPPQPPVEQPVNINKQDQDQVQKQNQDQKSIQDQFQDQLQNQNNTIGELLQKQSTESDADSNADSTSVNSATQTNVQVNNNSNRIEYGDFKIPETTLNINGYVTENGDFGGIVGVTIPLGGRSRKSINKGLEIKVAADQLALEQSFSSVCANIADGGFVVTQDANTLEMLKTCPNEIRKTQLVARNAPPAVTPPPAPVVDSNAAIIEQLRTENAELKILIAQLAEKIDKGSVNGGY